MQMWKAFLKLLLPVLPAISFVSNFTFFSHPFDEQWYGSVYISVHMSGKTAYVFGK